MEGIPENERVEGEPLIRSFEELRGTGLLWLINRVVLHPRGFALALHYPEGAPRDEIVAGRIEPIGWSIVGDGEEPWFFWNTEHRRVAVEAGADPELMPEQPGNEDDAFTNVEALLAAAKREGL